MRAEVIGKKITKISFWVCAVIVGALFTIGALFFIFSSSEYVVTKATVTKIYQDDSSVDEIVMLIDAEYKDDNGNTHTVEGFNYQSGYEVGTEFDIQYDINNPDNCASVGGEFVQYILLAVGIILFIAGITTIIKTIKAPSEVMSEYDRVKLDNIDPSLIDEVRNSNEPKNDYIFHFTGKLNQSYVMKDSTKREVYNAICDHMGILSKSKFTFTNRVTLKSKEHEVSHTISNQYSSARITITTDSSFKVDGISCWDVLAGMGYSLSPRIEKINPTYDVYKYGVLVGSFTQAGKNIILDENKQSKLGDVLTAPGFYKINCRESDLDGVFFACFAIARTFVR